jgi:hypothetical protein
MLVVVEKPPLWDEISKAFPVANRGGVVFAFGKKIYNPSGVKIPPELMAHESVHGQRQRDGVNAWWLKYINDPLFRLQEEIPAHRAEYARFCELQRDRNFRSVFLNRIARRLSGPLYGGLITHRQAMDAIR